MYFLLLKIWKLYQDNWDKSYHVRATLYSFLSILLFSKLPERTMIYYTCVEDWGTGSSCANKCSTCVFSLPILGRASFWRLIIIGRLRALKGCLFTYNWDWRKKQTVYLPVIKQKHKAWLLHFCVPFCLASGYLVSIHVSY